MLFTGVQVIWKENWLNVWSKYDMPLENIIKIHGPRALQVIVKHYTIRTKTSI